MRRLLTIALSALALVACSGAGPRGPGGRAREGGWAVGPDPHHADHSRDLRPGTADRATAGEHPGLVPEAAPQPKNGADLTVTVAAWPADPQLQSNGQYPVGVHGQRRKRGAGGQGRLPVQARRRGLDRRGLPFGRPGEFHAWSRHSDPHLHRGRADHGCVRQRDCDARGADRRAERCDVPRGRAGQGLNPAQSGRQLQRRHRLEQPLQRARLQQRSERRRQRDADPARCAHQGAEARALRCHLG